MNNTQASGETVLTKAGWTRVVDAAWVSFSLGFVIVAVSWATLSVEKNWWSAEGQQLVQLDRVLTALEQGNQAQAVQLQTQYLRQKMQAVQPNALYWPPKAQEVWDQRQGLRP